MTAESKVEVNTGLGNGDFLDKERSEISENIFMKMNMDDISEPEVGQATGNSTSGRWNDTEKKKL